jgi:hypothetical protein
MEVKIELITEEELLIEKSKNVNQIGIAIYQDKNGDDIVQRLPYHYRVYADIFSQENIETLTKHSNWDHKIDFTPGAKPLFGPLYSCFE